MSDRWVSLASSRRPKSVSKWPHNSTQTLVVNLYGGPGTGKSTTAALVFAMLKQQGYTAELVTEFAKDLVWEGRRETLEDQVYILGKQSHRVSRLLGKVDVVVSDSPILLTYVYSRNLSLVPQIALCSLAAAIHNETRSLDFFIVRDNEKHPYNPKGRYQDLAGAEEVDREVRKYVSPHVNFINITVGDEAAEEIVDYVEAELASAD